LDKAMWLAVELETIARQYFLSLSIGGPVLLPDAEIARVMEGFKSYGPRPKDQKAETKGKKKAS
jgi:L-fuculose-phosphate aldolase